MHQKVNYLSTKFIYNFASPEAEPTAVYPQVTQISQREIGRLAAEITVPVPHGFPAERQDLSENITQEKLRIPEIPKDHDLMNSTQNANVLRNLKADLHFEAFQKDLLENAQTVVDTMKDLHEKMQGEPKEKLKAIFEDKSLTPAERQKQIIALYQDPSIRAEVAKLDKVMPGASSSWDQFINNLQNGAVERFNSMGDYFESWGSVGENVGDFGFSPTGAFGGAVFGFAISVPWMESWSEPYSVWSMALGTLIFSNTVTAGYTTDIAVKVLEGAGGILEQLRQVGFGVANGFRDAEFLEMINDTLGKQKNRLKDMGEQFQDYQEPLKSYWGKIYQEKYHNKEGKTQAEFTTDEIRNIAQLVNVGAKDSMNLEQSRRFSLQLMGSESNVDTLLLKKYMADSALGGLHAYFMKKPKNDPQRKAYLHQLQIAKANEISQQVQNMYNRDVVGKMNTQNYSKMQEKAEWKTGVAMSLNSASGLVGWIIIMTQILALGAMGVSKFSSTLFGDGDKEKRAEKKKSKEALKAYGSALGEIASRGDNADSKTNHYFDQVLRILQNPTYKKRDIKKAKLLAWKKNAHTQGPLTSEEAQYLKKHLKKEEKKSFMSKLTAGNFITKDVEAARKELLGFSITYEKSQTGSKSIGDILGNKKTDQKKWEAELTKKRVEIYSEMVALRDQLKNKNSATPSKGLIQLFGNGKINEVIKMIERWGGEGYNIIDQYHKSVIDQKDKKGGDKAGERAEDLYKGLEKMIGIAEGTSGVTDGYKEKQKGTLTKVTEKIAGLFKKEKTKTATA